MTVSKFGNVFQLDKMKENRLCCNYGIGFVLLDCSSC